MIWVTLTKDESVLAARVTLDTYEANRQMGIPRWSRLAFDSQMTKAGFLLQEYESRCAEVAVRKWASVPLDIPIARSLAEFERIAHDEWDVPGLCEVKHTFHRGGGLAIKPHLPEDRPYMLVRGVPPHLQLAGWAWGFEAKRAEFWNTSLMREPAFLMPAVELHSPEQLMAERILL